MTMFQLCQTFLLHSLQLPDRKGYTLQMCDQEQMSKLNAKRLQ